MSQDLRTRTVSVPVDKSMIGNTFLKKIRWKCILKEFVVLWGAAGDEQHNKFGANYITAR